MSAITQSHTSCEVTCSTCGASPDQRCWDAEGEFAVTEAAAEEEVTREESARDLFVEDRVTLASAAEAAADARRLRLEGRHAEAHCALNRAAWLRRFALDAATQDAFWIAQLKYRCDRKSRG